MTHVHPFASIAERRITEAQARGEFDDLPGHGKPIPGAGVPDDAGWWVRRWIERQRREDEDSGHAARDDMLGGSRMVESEQPVRSAVADWNDHHSEQLDTADVLTTWRAMASRRRRLSR